MPREDLLISLKLTFFQNYRILYYVAGHKSWKMSLSRFIYISVRKIFMVLELLLEKTYEPQFVLNDCNWRHNARLKKLSMHKMRARSVLIL